MQFSEDIRLVKLLCAILQTFSLCSSHSLESVAVDVFIALIGDFALNTTLSIEAEFRLWTRFIVHYRTHRALALMWRFVLRRT